MQDDLNQFMNLNDEDGDLDETVDGEEELAEEEEEEEHDTDDDDASDEEDVDHDG